MHRILWFHTSVSDFCYISCHILKCVVSVQLLFLYNYVQGLLAITGNEETHPGFGSLEI